MYAFEKQLLVQYTFLLKREITIKIKHLGYIALFFIVNLNNVHINQYNTILFSL